VEADLARFYGLDYRDRWRWDEHGDRRLTLRQIFVRVRHLPVDSAVLALEHGHEPVWRLEHVLLADVWQQVAHSKKPHPMLVAEQRRSRGRQSTRITPERARKLADGRRRARERRLQLDS
jgi:hypothetical protein